MEGSRRRGSYSGSRRHPGTGRGGGRRSAQSIRLRKRQRLMRKILVWILCLAVMAGIAFGVSRVVPFIFQGKSSFGKRGLKNFRQEILLER